MLERDIQNLIRIAISENRLGTCFRTNVGQAYTGNKIVKNQNGTITIYDPRPFKSGLPEGFSDLIVVTPLTITLEMIGQKVALASFLEVKDAKRKPTPEQLNFLEQMTQLGARAGIARSVDDAIKILRS